MKKLIVFFIFFQAFNLLGQNDTLGSTFIMKGNYRATKCDGVGILNTPNTSEILLRDFKIKVDAITPSGYVIKVIPFNSNPAYNLQYVNNGSSVLYFFIPLNVFRTLCEKTISRHSFTVGIPTIPAKLRFGNGGKGSNPRYFRFEGDLNLGLSAGYKYSFGKDNQYAFNVVVGFTTSSVQVDSLTTKGKVNSTTSAASFSPHTGVVFDFQNFQFGLYSGIDFLYGEPNRYWVYRNQPWLGIGIGYSLFKIGNSKGDTVKNEVP